MELRRGAFHRCLGQHKLTTCFWGSAGKQAQKSLADFNNLTKCMRRQRQSKTERMPRGAAVRATSGFTRSA